MSLITKMFGTHSEHELKRIYPIVDKIDSLRPKMQKLSDAELRGKTQEFKDRLARVRPWMTSCRKLLRLYVKLVRECLVWSISVYS